MVDDAIPKLFHATFGGTLRLKKSKYPNRRDIFCWQIGGHTALPFLKALLPYVILKKPQFEVIMHLLENTYWRGKRPLTDEELALREADYILCKELKHAIPS
jgi:hypothetical protein